MKPHHTEHPRITRHRPSALAAASFAACAAWAASAANPAWAQVQAQTQPLAEAAQRVEIIGVTPLSALGVPKDQVPANVQTARAADLARSQALDLSDFLSRRMGSVHVNDVQGNPYQPDLNFRGYTASPLLGTPQGLSVYVDGVRLNQPFGDVVSWDLIPKSAISTVTLMPGSNPLFGLNTLGGALAVTTKDGLRNPGTTVQLTGGSNSRVAAEFEHGSSAAGWDWYLTGNRFHEKGWRSASPSDVNQLFGKLGLKTPGGNVTLSLALADNDLTGNGLQEARLLANDYRSVLSSPDNTKNKSALVNLATTQQFGGGLSFSGNAYHRQIKTRTYNGDLNEGSFDQAIYLTTTSAAERAALTAAGFTGLPTVTETAANTPFPKWRCIAQKLLVDEPGEKCTGVINTTQTKQSNQGLAGQFSSQAELAGMQNLLVVGAAADFSRMKFLQGSELGYLNADRTVTGVGAFGDGVTGGDVDGEPYDTRVDLVSHTRTYSVFASDTLALNAATHLTVSARYNHTAVKNRDGITPGNTPGGGSLDGDHHFQRVNPAIGLTFAATPSLTAYAGLNQGSRAPTAVELGCADPEHPCKLPNAFAGDPPLNQVVTTTLEAGFRGSNAAGTSWNLSLFSASSRDDILFVADNASGFGYFKNFGQTRRQGLEAGFTTRLGSATLGLNYSFLEATYQSKEVVMGASNSTNSQVAAGLAGTEGGTVAIRPGNRIPLMPRHVLKAFFSVPVTATLTVGGDLNGTDGAYARGNENNAHRPDGTYFVSSGRSSGYAVFNLNAEWQPLDRVKLFARVNNLFDRRYSNAAQLGPAGLDAQGAVKPRPFPAYANGDRPLVHSTFYAPGAPRAVWIGAQYDFGR